MRDNDRFLLYEAMSPGLRRILFGLIFVTILGVFVWLSPQFLSLYYQVKGGQHLDRSLSRMDSAKPDLYACIPIKEESTLEQVSQAVVSLERSSRINPRSSQPYLLLGRAYCLMGKLDSAVDAYLEYTKLRPENPLGHLELGFVYESLGDKVSAAREWDSAGLSAQDFFARGNQAQKANHLAEALKWYQGATELAPSMVDAWQQMALIYEGQDAWEKALGAYEKAWENNPEAGTSILVSALQRQGNDKEAEEILRKALKDFPQSANRHAWWQSLGENLKSQAEWESAVQVYQSALEEYPLDVDFYIQLGWSYYENGAGFERAKEAFEQAISLDEDLGDGYFAVGQLLVREKRYADSDRWFRQAIERKSGDRWWYIARGNAARAAGDMDLAKEVYLDTITRFPDFPQGYFEIALAYRLDEQIEDATSAIEQAIALSKSPTPWYFARAGRIYEQGGRLNKALDAYRYALEIDPENSVALDGVSRLGGWR